MTETLHHWIGGRKVAGDSGRFGDIYNPAIGEKTAQVPFASAAEVRRAVEAALAAFPEWAAKPAAQRAAVMFKFRERVLAHMDELAELVSKEHGKTLIDAKGSITRGVEVVEFATGIAHHLKGDHTVNVGTNVDSYSLRAPLGVVAGITPFNFPAMIPMWMFPMAVACGNTVVLKPSERTPSCPLRLAQLAEEAGLPPGVLNVVNGDRQAVDAILDDPDIQAVSFVGSTPVAEHIYHRGTGNNKRVQALGGAKNHMIIMPDAGRAVAGERCMAVAVAVTVGDAVGDAFIERMKPRVRALKVGPYSDPEVDMGPLVTKQHYDKVMGYIDLGIKEGAELVVDGRDLTLQGYENGYFMGGSLFDRVTPEMRIYQEEIFGPVLSVMRAKNYDEAIGLANDHEFGNGVAIFTRDGDAARSFAIDSRIGMVGINVPIPVPVAYHSFGGWKRSLFGDIHMHGPEGVKFYTKLKTVTARWPTGIRAGAEFHFKGGAHQ
jgi:malonate-semialdehyde dehydrogenase (acetylating)/methylmalonate-semialdehyde dehydrogenase